MTLISILGRALAAGGVVLALVLAAFGFAGGPGASAPAALGSEASWQDALNVGIVANPPALDVHGVNSNIVSCIGMHIYEPLFALDKDRMPRPVLAESYEVSDDGLAYTIRLREDVKFHNGKVMDAGDVVASMNAWLARSAKAELLAGSSFSAVDDLTVRLDVPEPMADVVNQLATPIQFAAIYPASAVEAAAGGDVTECVGTGPYRLAEWDADKLVRLERFEGYSQPAGEPSGLTGRKAAVAPTINFRVLPDDNARLSALRAGSLDVAEELPLKRHGEIASDRGLRASVQTGGTLSLFLNTSEGPLASLDLRQAVLAALDMDEIMQAAYGNEKLYALDPSWCPLADVQWRSASGASLYDQNDRAKAKELMDKAGYRGQTLTLVTTFDYSDMYLASLVVQEQLRQAGFNVEMEESDFATFMERRADPGQYDLFITSNAYSPSPVQLPVLSPAWAGLDTPELAAGVAKIRASKTPEEAKAAWDETQGLLYDCGAATVLGHYASLYAMDTDVEGFAYLRYPVYWNAGVRA
ncbi:ABC transporter substrate-binding protein [Atopobiaceae bacterium 24-176]